MNRRTVLPINRTNTISQYNDQRYEIMNSSVHIRIGREGEMEYSCIEGSV